MTEKHIDIELFLSPDADGGMTLHSNKLLDVLKISSPIATFLEQRDRGGPRVLFEELDILIRENGDI
jgi:hypothetical protein